MALRHLAGDILGHVVGPASLVLKATTRAGLLYWPVSMFLTTLSKLALASSVSR